MSRPAHATSLALAILLISTTAAADGLRTGDPVPGFRVRDLTGRWRTSHELLGRPTVVVAMGSVDAADGMRPWVEEAQRRFGRTDVHVVSMVALDLPFFASWSMASSRARDNVPAPLWPDTWLDRDGTLRSALHLDPDSEHPYVFVLDEVGQVVAEVHGPMVPRNAAVIWSSLRGRDLARQSRYE